MKKQHPELEYESDSKVRIFNDLMSHSLRKNDYNSGSQLNLANYESLFPLIFFDLSFQTEKVTRDPKQLIFRYRLSANANQNFSVHAVVLYEEQNAIDKIGNGFIVPQNRMHYLILYKDLLNMKQKNYLLHALQMEKAYLYLPSSSSALSYASQHIFLIINFCIDALINSVST